MRIDLHQHLWPTPFIAALRQRSAPPLLHGWTLELDGEPAFAVDPRAHDSTRRAADADDDLVCLSPAVSLGIDRLPAAETDRLAAAWLEGALALPAPFRAWATARTPRALEEALAGG